jgi:hypothetical protein
MHVSHHDINDSFTLDRGSRTHRTRRPATNLAPSKGVGLTTARLLTFTVRARGVVRSERKVRSSSGLRCKGMHNCHLITLPRPVPYAMS